MSAVIHIEPLTTAAFAPFGDVIAAEGPPDRLINRGLCGRYHDRAKLAFEGGRAGLSLFNTPPVTLPYTLDMVERHPLGSQAFLPLSGHPFMIIVCPDIGGQPGRPRAFHTAPGQGINYHRSTWHGILTPLYAPGLFAVVDRIADDPNLEEFWFDTPFRVEADTQNTRLALGQSTEKERE